MEPISYSGLVALFPLLRVLKQRSGKHLIGILHGCCILLAQPPPNLSLPRPLRAGDTATLRPFISASREPRDQVQFVWLVKSDPISFSICYLSPFPFGSQMIHSKHVVSWDHRCFLVYSMPFLNLFQFTKRSLDSVAYFCVLILQRVIGILTPYFLGNLGNT